jgi:hypothetical protein
MKRQTTLSIVLANVLHAVNDRTGCQNLDHITNNRNYVRDPKTHQNVQWRSEKYRDHLVCCSKHKDRIQGRQFINFFASTVEHVQPTLLLYINKFT